MYQKIIAVLVGVLVFLSGVKGQSNDVKFINASKEDYVKRIDFVNKKTGTIINTYDVIANNPYNHLNFPVIDIKQKNKVYDIKNISQTDVNYFVSKRKPLSLSDLRPTKAFSEANIGSYYSIYTAVAYNLTTFNKDNYIINFHSTTKILDNNGNVIKVFQHLDYEDINPIVSNNGKYYSLSYGGSLNPDENPMTNNGYRIYDIATSKLLYQEEHGSDTSPPFATVNSAFIIHKQLTEKQDEYKIIDIEADYIVKCVFDTQDLPGLSQLNPLVTSLRNDIKLKKSLDPRFQLEKINFYQKK
jgi:hypothetical protein